MTILSTLKKNTSVLISFAVLILLCIFFVQSGLFSSSDQMKLFLDQMGILAPMIFILLQIIQVVIPVIPGGVSCVIGVVVFGPFYGFIYNYIGLAIGSTINFLLAKKYGKTVLLKFVSEKNYEKYTSWLEKGKKFDILFTLALFLPGSPDDFLCLLAGLTPMSCKKFLTVFLLSKPLSLVGYSVGLSVITSWLTSVF